MLQVYFIKRTRLPADICICCACIETKKLGEGISKTEWTFPVGCGSILRDVCWWSWCTKLMSSFSKGCHVNVVQKRTHMWLNRIYKGCHAHEQADETMLAPLSACSSLLQPAGLYDCGTGATAGICTPANDCRWWHATTITRSQLSVFNFHQQVKCCSTSAPTTPLYTATPPEEHAHSHLHQHWRAEVRRYKGDFSK